MSGQTSASGSTIIGNRITYSESDLAHGTFSSVAETDGLVVAILGTVSGDLSQQFAGVLNASTTMGTVVTSSMVTAASTRPYTTSSGKKGSVTVQVPTFGNLSMPVRQGETWTVSLVTAPQGMGLPPPALVFYWVPLGTGTGSGTTVSTSGSDAVTAAMSTTFGQLRSNVAAGGPVGSLTPDAVMEAQRIIDERVDDFTRVLGDAAGMTPAEEVRRAFIADLQAIVCRAAPTGTVAPQVRPQDLDRLTDTFSRLTGHTLTDGQRDLLKDGIRALVSINETAANRNDLVLIRGNIATFIDTVGSILGRTIDIRSRRLLTRALVRLVGDGARQPDEVDPLLAAAE